MSIDPREIRRRPFRFFFIPQRTVRPHKGLVRLALLVPHQCGYELNVIVKNKKVGAGTLLPLHEGRGSLEGIFGEIPQKFVMGNVPLWGRFGNQMCPLAGLCEHSLTWRLQMETMCQFRGATKQRSAFRE